MNFLGFNGSLGEQDVTETVELNQDALPKKYLNVVIHDVPLNKRGVPMPPMAPLGRH